MTAVYDPHISATVFISVGVVLQAPSGVKHGSSNDKYFVLVRALV